MDAVTLNVVVDVELMDVEVGRDAVKCDDPRRAKSGTRIFSVFVTESLTLSDVSDGTTRCTES